MPTARTVLPAVIAATLASTIAVASLPAQSPQFQYTAKIVCGLERDSLHTLVPQLYATTINVHNPSDKTARYRKRLLMTVPPGDERHVPAKWTVAEELPAEEGMAVSCTDLRRHVEGLPPFFEGFIILDSTVSLDVVGVYTVPGGIDVERVLERAGQAK